MDSLEGMWDEHKDYQRRLLIGLARDIDLADDLLQETYIRAQASINGYRGGDARAWLAAIARSIFYTHVRRMSFSCERTGEIADLPSTSPELGSEDHIDALNLRQALSSLSPDLRTALLMKHFGGFTYEEISGHVGCPVGTAKSRVSAAVDHLRQALAGDVSGVCRRIRLLDLIYNILPNDEADQVRRHIEACPNCKLSGRELNRVGSILDMIDGEYKMMHIVEIDDRGRPTLYVTMNRLNYSEESATVDGFFTGKPTRLASWTIQGEQVEYKSWPSEEVEGRVHYQASLPRPVEPGGRVESLVVFGFEDEHCAVPLGAGRYRFEWNQRPGDKTDFVYVQAIRLPAGARLLASGPKPREVRRKGVRTTVTWTSFLAPREQFRSVLEYELD